MSDAKRYKAALVSQYSDVVLAIDHDAAPSEDGGEVKRWALSLYNDCGGYSPKMVDPETLPNPETRTRYVLESDYLECRSIVAAKDAEIARLRKESGK